MNINSSIAAKRIFAGMLAGASTVLTIVAVLALIMLASGLVGTIYTLSSGVYGKLSVSQAFFVTMRLALGVLIFVVWGGRWAFPALCLQGLLLALTELSTTRVRLRGRSHLGFCLTFGLLVAIVLGYQFVHFDNPPIWFGILIALPGAWIIWVGWVTWYYLWVVWIGALPPHKYGPAVAPLVAKDFLWAQARIAWLKRATGPEETNPFSTPLDQIILPYEGLWTRTVFAAWVVTTLLLWLLLWWSSRWDQSSRALVLCPMFGIWFGLGALLLIELLAAMSWLDLTSDDRS